MSNRINPNLDPSIAAQIAAPPSQPSTPTTPERSKATFDLDPATIQAIRDIAADLEVPVYTVAQKLLDHALGEYERGRLELRRKAVTTQWRLE